MDLERQKLMVGDAVNNYREITARKEQRAKEQRLDFKSKADSLMSGDHFQPVEDPENLPAGTSRATGWFDTTDFTDPETGAQFQIKTRLVKITDISDKGFMIQTKINEKDKPGRVVTNHQSVALGASSEEVWVSQDGETFEQDEAAWHEAYATVRIAFQDLAAHE